MIESLNEARVALRPDQLSGVAEVYSCLQHLDQYYPDFERWYWNSVVPGLADGTRLLSVVRNEDKIVAALIAKRTEREKKLCTLWVHSELAGKGLGVRLINEGRKWVGSNMPLASVPEERMPELAGILGRMGFVMTQKLDSYYRPGKTEFVFNGTLAPVN